ncbi:glycoside hydrolase family 76 protein [Macroventuria anomochaeta]|uniref:Glycoside hydrolase family 76 protein n=1 Tax=Macroventuria anomochaeta TaxID=301207 RepID=A0ACB6RH18_9PLEO|nr:glycoside hydrolase family 76 protein [Macroventuria anomochaeta]KAF2621058.1 glycoside hydrolase family 76 protein [Macroventuria anomochaeta]
MLARSGVLSLAFTLLTGHAAAIDLDINSKDSIKSAAKVLASGIVAFYDETLNEDLIPGLFPHPYYWWESGLAFNALVDYYGLTNDSEYNSRISEALQHQLGDYDAFMPANQTKVLGNDDQSFWGLASLSAHEVQLPAPASGSWLEFAKNVFDTQTSRWDTHSCDGGLKWQIFTFNDGYNYKNAASNGQLFLLAARLADQTGNATYAEWANKIYNWTTEVGLVSADQHVYDGTDDRQNCSAVNHIQWTNNHAEFTEGAALMYKASNGSQKWTDIVTGFVKASSTFTGDGGALIEAACEKNGKCDIDQRAFKGIAVRSFGRAAQVAPIVADSIHAMLNASAKGAAKNCESGGDNVVCGLSWSSSSNGTSEQATAADGNLGEVLNALQAIQALLWPTVKFINSTIGTVSPNATTSGSPTGTSDGAQHTGSGATLAASFTLVLAIAFTTALSC